MEIKRPPSAAAKNFPTDGVRLNPSADGGNPDPVQEILALMGDMVLIPNRRLTKHPVGKNWQKRTWESMRDAAYTRLFIGKNIGVLLGKPSGGLCTVDIDT